METHKVFSAAIVLMIIAGAVSSILAYSETIYKMDRSTGLLSRAETGGFVEDLAAYLERARELLPNSGNPVWLFSTDRTDFGEIQRDVTSILERAHIVSAVPRNSETYQQGMDDLRDKIRTLQEQVSSAAPFMLLSPLNILSSIIWLLIMIGLLLGYSKFRRRSLEKNFPVNLSS